MFPHNILYVGYASTDVKLTRCDSLVQFVQLLQAVIDKTDNSCGWTCIVRTKQLICNIYTYIQRVHLSVCIVYSATLVKSCNCYLSPILIAGQND